MTTEIVPINASVTLFGTDDPQGVVDAASARAKVLANVIREKHLAVGINNREYVRVEGWTLLGTMLGVFPICVWSRRIDDGWEARVEARTLNDRLVGAAEAQCDRSENTWKTRSDFALRSMAQTRATSKALRLPLGFIMALAGYETTPAEEMDALTTAQAPVRKARTKPAPAEAAPPKVICDHEPSYTAEGVFECSLCHEALDPREESMQSAEENNAPACSKCGKVMAWREGKTGNRTWQGWFCPERGHPVVWTE